MGDEEEPLEIVDYSTLGPFEQSVEAIEQFFRKPHVMAVLQGTPKPAAENSEKRPHEATAVDGFSSKSKANIIGEEISNSVNGESVVVEVHQNDVNHPVSKLLFVSRHHRQPSTGSTVSATSMQQPFLLCRFASTSFHHRREDSAGMLSLMSCAVESLISATTCSSSRHHTSHHTASPAPAGQQQQHQPLWLVGLPCFAPTGDSSKGTFSGICRGARTTTRYSIEFFPTCPPALLYLTVGFERAEWKAQLKNDVSEKQKKFFIASKNSYGRNPMKSFLIIPPHLLCYEKCSCRGPGQPNRD